MAPQGEIQEAFFMRMPGDSICMMDNGELPVPGLRVRDAALGPNVACMFKLRPTEDSDEVVGWAIQISEQLPLEETGGVLFHREDWTLMLHGRGTISFSSINNKSSGATELMPNFQISDPLAWEPWDGDWTFVITAGPREDRRGEIIGGTGEFYGATGTGQKILRMKHIDPKAHEEIEVVEQVRVFYTLSGPEPERILLDGVLTEAGSPARVEPSRAS